MKNAAVFLSLLVLQSIACAISAAGNQAAMNGEVLTFSEPTQLTFGEGHDEDPSLIFAQDGHYYMAWFSDRSGDGDIWMIESRDGINWSQPWQITSGPDGDFYPALIQSQDGDFHLSWFRIDDEPPYISNIWYSSSPDAKNWSRPLQITDAPGVDWAPALVEDQNHKLWIYWASSRTGNKDIFAKFFDGANWSAMIQITNHPDQDDYPTLVVSQDGSFNLVWNRYQGNELDGTGSHVQTLYATSVDGQNWSEELVIYSPEKENQVAMYPILYQGSEDLQVAWTSNDNDPYGEIHTILLSDPETEYQLTDTSSMPDYTPRFAPTDEKGTYLMVWIVDVNIENRDVFSRFITFPW